MRGKEVQINDDMTVVERVEPGKVKIVVLDGNQGRAKVCEAVEHGFTIVETAKGKAAKIKFEDNELF